MKIVTTFQWSQVGKFKILTDYPGTDTYTRSAK